MSSKELLRRAGLRATEPRCAVLAVLLEADHALSPAEIAGRPSLQGIDRVSVYRSLGAISAAGLAHGVSGPDGVTRYRAHQPGAEGCPGDHPHFFCTACGGMWCLPAQRLPFVQVPPGASVTSKQLVVNGRCGGCQPAGSDQ